MIRLPRLDTGPLLAELERRGLSRNAFARLCQEDETHVRRLLRGPLSWFVADRFAVALELHPANLWGDAWWEIAATFDEQRAARKEKERARGRRETVNA